MKKPFVAPALVLTIGILAVSTASLFIRKAQAEAPSLVIAAYRLTLASLVLVPLAWRWYRHELRRLEPVDWRWAIASGVFLALHFATWITSLEYTTIASSVVLVSTSPLWVALAAWLLLRERLARLSVVGLVVAMVGVAVVSLSDTVCAANSHWPVCSYLAGRVVAAQANAPSAGKAPLVGNGLALAGAFAVTGYLLIGRRLRSKLSLTPYVAVVYGTAAAVLLATVVAARQPLVGYRPAVYGWFLLLALGPQLIGHSSFNWALAHLPATFVAIATLGEPIGSTALAYLFFDEALSWLKGIGAVLILTGIVFTLRSQGT
jgi:drug/metabolite transporter (DMT)-like permease